MNKVFLKTLWLLIVLVFLTSCNKEIKKIDFGPVDKNLEDKFSYSYAYRIMDTMILNNINIDVSYFSKGSFDALSGIELSYSDDEVNELFSQMMPLLDDNEIKIETKTKVYNDKTLKNLKDAKTEIEVFSYVYGYISALNFNYNAFDSLTPTPYISGLLTRYYELTPNLSEEEMEKAFDDFISSLNKRIATENKEISDENKKIAKNFLDENSNKEGVIVLDSGVEIVFEKTVEEGQNPKRDDTILVNYKLSLLDGFVADEGVNVVFPLTSLIPGFVDAVTNMKIGEKIICYIPPELGYGEQSLPNIPPSSLLIFDIELLDIEK